MGKSTKLILANALKNLMKDMQLSKISVSDITESCNLNRQTFYYHFTDKYKLVNWIFDREILDNVENYLNYEHWSKALEKVFSLVESDSGFYLNALRDNFSYFYIHLMRTQRNILDEFIENLLEGRRMKKSDREFFSDFYTNAFVGTFVSWVTSSMHEPAETVVTRLEKLIRGSLKNVLEDYIR
ncbi:MAG: TetR/AcrR family transcriptional regulator C-terminal domain-containing protein [Spirochaetales bacterium]|uniref:TetR/AcrR family transcriptional regulator C-terminal domain-containing protein n=1 Tax=Candidatus Thalassospirochaeta sargassi TaxID=3119039 RepID=A0AAJ1II97_9SPIO|nr:TetR/AcrR family transcriptional regulator C-terminal domain-containing protein [Spirochaetales bacterium]